MSLVGFKAKNHRQQVAKRGADDGVDERITPESVYLPLHAEHGFTLDAAASRANAKCEKFFSLAKSGLNETWADLNDRIVKIAVSQPSPECLEPGQAFALDLENGKIYLLDEWGPGEENVPIRSKSE